MKGEKGEKKERKRKKEEYPPICTRYLLDGKNIIEKKYIFGKGGGVYDFWGKYIPLNLCVVCPTYPTILIMKQ